MTSSSAPAEHALPEARIRGAFGTDLLVAIDATTDRLVVDVRYVLRNDGTAALAVFDRGNVHDIGIGRQALGGIGIPRQEPTGDDLTLVHAAMALPEPSPTSPPTPLAIELAPGATLAARFQTMVQADRMPKRLRWCVGVLPTSDVPLNSPQDTKDGRIWVASFAAAERQHRVCTPWYDVARGAFEA
ncbi:MAG: hypothetical protein IT473_10260 [Lysobacter sp.]|nr:hypothetical protein [Lysobacter sp.]